MTARRHMTQTWTSSFLQTSLEFLSVRRLGSVLERVTRAELRDQAPIRGKEAGHVTAPGCMWLYQVTPYLMECLAALGAEEEGEGRLQSPCRSSMERLQGESRDEDSPVPSGCSPSNLHQETRRKTVRKADPDRRCSDHWPGLLTHVTAYWAKDKYSTRTSRPRFSSFRNSLTHLQQENSEQSESGPGPGPKLGLIRT